MRREQTALVKCDAAAGEDARGPGSVLDCLRTSASSVLLRLVLRTQPRSGRPSGRPDQAVKAKMDNRLGLGYSLDSRT